MTTIMKSEVLAALKLALKLADRKSTMPMLSRLKLSATGGVLSVTATDLDTWVTAELPCKGDDLAPCTVDSRRFVQAVDECAKRRRGRNSPDKRIDLTLTAGPTGAHTLTVQGDATYTVDATEAKDYPRLRPTTFDAEPVTYDGAKLADGLAFVAPAICQDETRFHLNGAFLCAKGSIVATDGHRLHKVDGFPTLEIEGADKYRANGYIVCNVAVRTLCGALKAFEPAVVLADFKGTGARFTMAIPGGTFTVTTKLIDSQYPPYEAVIPRHTEVGLDLDREAGADAARSANKLCSETRGMILASCQAATVMSVKCDEGEMRRTVPATHKGDSNFYAGVNARYLAEALEGMDSERVSVDSLGGELDPFTVADGAKLAVIMPMRI